MSNHSEERFACVCGSSPLLGVEGVEGSLCWSWGLRALRIPGTVMSCCSLKRPTPFGRTAWSRYVSRSSSARMEARYHRCVLSCPLDSFGSVALPKLLKNRPVPYRSVLVCEFLCTFLVERVGFSPIEGREVDPEALLVDDQIFVAMAAPGPWHTVLPDEVSEPFPRCLVVERRIFVRIRKRDQVRMGSVFVGRRGGGFPFSGADKLPEFFECSNWNGYNFTSQRTPPLCLWSGAGRCG